MSRASLLAVPAPVRDLEPGRRARRRERRRLVEQDRRAADQAGLFFLGRLLADASDLVTAGWVQHCWFTIRDANGKCRRIGPRNLHELDGQPISEMCLVGAIVQAAGGVAHAGTGPVHGAIDLTWATLFDEAEWRSPSARVRLARIHDLIGWNDAAGRRPEQVAGLLVAAAHRAGS